MFFNAKNGTLNFGGKTMDYISFGNGKKVLIIIPGIGDGFKTVKGTAFPFAFMYRSFAKDFRVFVFSRICPLPEAYSNEDMAKDVRLAMVKLGISSASVIGISQGGMIAQYLALDYPASVEKLVLAVTSAKPNPVLLGTIIPWIQMAKNGGYNEIMIDTSEKSYSEAFLLRRRKLYPFVGLLGKPKDFGRFITEAEACINHNSFSRLGEIKCPTFVIGGTDDRILGAAASMEIAEKIPQSEIFMYEGLGHGCYEEAKNFNEKVIEFLRK